MNVSKNNLDQAIAAAREALADYEAYGHAIGGYALRDLLAALDAQPIAGEVWQYRANSTSRGKEWIDCRDQQRAREMEALGFEIRCLYAAPPAALAVPERRELPPPGPELNWDREQGYVDGWNECRIAMLLKAQQPAAAVPEGYVLVPVEPTPEMIAAGWFGGEMHIALGHANAYRECEGDYARLLAAAERKGE